MNYNVTGTNQSKGHISFDVILDGEIILSDTRCDVPLDDLDAQDAELTRFSDVVIEDLGA